MTLKYPTLEEVEKASKVQLGTWWRHLDSPGVSAIGNSDASFEQVSKDEAVIQRRIAQRFNDLGGWDPATSKAVGWDRR